MDYGVFLGGLGCGRAMIEVTHTDTDTWMVLSETHSLGNSCSSGGRDGGWGGGRSRTQMEMSTGVWVRSSIGLFVCLCVCVCVCVCVSVCVSAAMAHMIKQE